MSTHISPTYPSSDFSPEETQILEDEGLFLSPKTASGIRNVSIAIFGPPSSETSNPMSIATASVEPKGFDFDTSQYFEFPLSEDSAETLEFIGFTTPTARTIFNRWATRPNPTQCPDGLLDYGIGWIHQIRSHLLQGLSYDDAMQRAGLKDSLRTAILNPRFEQIFETESLLYWLKDTLKTNFAAIYRLQQRLKDHAARAIARNNGGQPAPSQHPPVTTTIHMPPEDHLLPTAHIPLGCEGSLLPNHVVLYKGISCKRLLVHPLIRENGSINLLSTISYEAGDFNWWNPAFYWHTDKEVAEEYRQWAAARCPTSETYLIRIQVPKTFIRSLRQIELLYGDKWKEYVWHSRRSQEPPAISSELRRPARVDIVRGHIYTGFSQDIATIAEDNAMRLPSDNNTKATQWAFLHRDSVEELARQVRGKMHIDLFAALEPSIAEREAEEWER